MVVYSFCDASSSRFGDSFLTQDGKVRVCTGVWGCDAKEEVKLEGAM
jgi:hypothetical protein